MKANYPEEYMSAVLTADAGDIEQISEFIAECERMKIAVLPPDINESFSAFSVVPNESKIRFGLTSIKNFGEGIGEVIIEERTKNGPFTSLSDFLRRVQNKNLNKKSLEALVMTGALDRFAPKDGGRGRLLINTENLLAYNREESSAVTGQDSLFSLMGAVEMTDVRLEPGADARAEDKLRWEKELLGVYVSGHPLLEFKEELEKRPSIKSVRADGREGIPAVVAGIIDDKRDVLTKSGEHMAFIRITDMTGTIEVVVFPKLLAEKKDVVEPQKCVAIKGRLSLRNGEPSIVAEAIKAL